MSGVLLGHQRRYRHYKGIVVEVIAHGRLEATEEPVVVYRDLDTGDVWVRAESVFNEMVEVNGQVVPRFSEILE